MDVRDTLKPNLSGNSEKRRCNRVLFPTPEGPEMTSGLMISESIVVVVGMVRKERTNRMEEIC